MTTSFSVLCAFTPKRRKKDKKKRLPWKLNSPSGSSAKEDFLCSDVDWSVVCRLGAFATPTVDVGSSALLLVSFLFVWILWKQNGGRHRQLALRNLPSTRPFSPAADRCAETKEVCFWQLPIFRLICLLTKRERQMSRR